MLVASVLAALTMALLGYAGGGRLGNFGDVGVDQTTFAPAVFLWFAGIGGLTVAMSGGLTRKPRPVVPPKPEPVESETAPEPESEDEVEYAEYAESDDEVGPEPEPEPDQPLVSWSAEEPPADEPVEPESVPGEYDEHGDDKYDDDKYDDDKYDDDEYDDVRETVYEPRPPRYEDLDDDPEEHFIVDDMPDDPVTGDQSRRAGD